jgi:hypothetical protein
MRLRDWVCLLVVTMGLLLVATPAHPQVNTVNLSGTVLDPQSLAVSNAKITAKNLATGAERSVESDSNGHYEIVGLPPGRYSVTIEAKGFSKLVNSELVLSLGVPAEYNPHVSLQAGEQTVTVTSEALMVETTRSAVSQTVDAIQIENLPINGRNYINFTLLNSQANRDSAPSIGAAPTSGLNFGGQRARSNEVSVDGADAVDNSVNGVRSTVSQEAVQEFQEIISNYMPEFGRATGAVINIVTKSGSNQTHGDIFGYFRHKDLQAQDPFSVQVNPLTGAVTPTKQAFTRVQAGATLGGPIQKDKTFYFFSYETTRRQETGFTDIGANQPGTGPFGLVLSTTPAIPGLSLPLTPDQKAFVNNPSVLGAPGGIALIQKLFAVAGSGSSVGLVGIDPGVISGAAPGARFPLPVPCVPGTLTPIPCPAGGRGLAPLPASYVPLSSLVGNYPIKEGTSLYSLRLDHLWNAKNSTFFRISVSPSLVTGIQVNAQNQNFGENAGSRTSLNQYRDLAFVAQHVTTISDSLFNEFRYQFARRGLHYGFSELPGGSNVGVNMLGFAFFGREPFSSVDRIERRNQWTDNLTWVHGRHTFKFGGDTNLIQVRSNTNQIFQLDYGGRFDFSSLSAGSLGLCPTASCTLGGVPIPGFSPVQAYGLGIPGDFIQGAGSSGRTFDNKTLGVFAQDSWRINSRFTLNYGVRYDIEWTPSFTPQTALNAAAESAMGVFEGIPVDSNNVAPRIGFAWDPTGSGKTVIRGGYGIFYDHPLLAIAFDAITADGALSSQLIFTPGAATALPLALNPVGALNASSLFQGVLNTTGIPNVGFVPSQQRFNPLLPNSIFINQNYLQAGIPLTVLPFTFPVARNFVFGYAQQAGLTVERELANDFKIGVTYSYTHGSHLNRARNSNAVEDPILVSNANSAVLSGLVTPGTNPLIVQVPATGAPGACVTTPGGGSISLIAPGILGAGFTGPCAAGAPSGSAVGFVGTPAIFNDFRPSGPNPSFYSVFPQCSGLTFPSNVNCGQQILTGLAHVAGFPTGVGVPVPWSDVVQQESSGNSVYHGLTLTVSKRFSHHFEIFSNYTYSHAIDDSTDLQSLLEPQDNRNLRAERANSAFDQRHRWVTNAVFESPYRGSDGGWYRKVLANFTVSPIFDVSSGRPYAILTGEDLNLDFSSSTDRPSLAPKGTPCGTPGTACSPFIPGVVFSLPTVCPTSLPAVPTPPFGCTGNLSRNAFYKPGFFTIDLRISRKIPITERWNLQVIADGFNLLNRFNVADVNLLCDPTAGTACSAGQPTADIGQRQFQFALKLNW